MKKLIFVLAFLCLSTTFIARETKYLIYFKDKGDVQQLKNDVKVIEEILNSFSEETIIRRAKVMGDDIITEADLPVNKKYIEVLQKNDVKIVRVLKWFNAVSAFLNDKQIDLVNDLGFVSRIDRVRKLKVIDPVEKNDKSLLRKQTSNTNNKYDYGYSLTQMELSEVLELHNLDINGEGVIIGLIDAGFKTSDISALEQTTVIDRYDFIQNDNVTENESGEIIGQDNHGTAVFSVCGGFEDGELIGPAFGAGFLLAKTENVAYERNVEEDNFAAACEWMESKGANIVSSSLGYSEFDFGENSYTYSDMDGKTAVTTKAYNKLFDLGVITIASAGNEGNKSWKYIASPGDAPGCITVGSVTSQNVASAFSSFGPASDGRLKPEISAMGSSVYLMGSSGKYAFASGTSFSTPIVAGITGQLVSVFPHITNGQVRHIIMNSGDHPGQHDLQKGYGLLSAKRVIEHPNLENLSGIFRLHKAFVDSNGIKSGSGKVHIIENGNEEVFNLQNGSKDYKFYIDLQDYNNSDLEIYFTYTDNQNNLTREPAVDNYKLKYGELNFTSVEKENIENEYPESFVLNQNYPNPFNPSTTISYSIPEEGNVKLEIFDVLGQKVKTLINRYQSVGSYEIKVKAVDLKNLSSGVYFYRLTINGSSQTKRMVLLR